MAATLPAGRPIAMASGVSTNQLSPASSRVTKRAWCAPGSEKKRDQLANPTHRNVPMTFQLVNDRKTAKTTGTTMKSP